MQFRLNLAFIACLLLCSACAQEAAPSIAQPPTPLITGAGNGSPISAATATPVSPGEYMSKFLPGCDGQEVLGEPITFDWPNIKKRSQDLEDGIWGYFHCAQPPADVVTFYKEKMVQPPYNMVEINWVERVQGWLGLYYYSPSQSWIYVWVIPQVEGEAGSNIITVLSDANMFRPGECRIELTGGV